MTKDATVTAGSPELRNSVQRRIFRVIAFSVPAIRGERPIVQRGRDDLAAVARSQSSQNGTHLLKLTPLFDLARLTMALDD